MSKDTKEDVSPDDVVSVLTESEADRMTTREVANALDVDRDRARKLLQELRDEGRVKRVKREKPQSPMWRLLE